MVIRRGVHGLVSVCYLLPALITAQALLFVSVMACHSLKMTQADHLYLSEK